jgi:hypothetical protein
MAVQLLQLVIAEWLSERHFCCMEMFTIYEANIQYMFTLAPPKNLAGLLCMRISKSRFLDFLDFQYLSTEFELAKEV